MSDVSTYRSKISEIPLLGFEIMRSSRQIQTEMIQDEVPDILALNACTERKLKRWTDDPGYLPEAKEVALATAVGPPEGHLG